MPETTTRKFGLRKKIKFLLFNGRQRSSVEQLSRDFGEYPPNVIKLSAAPASRAQPADFVTA